MANYMGQIPMLQFTNIYAHTNATQIWHHTINIILHYLREYIVCSNEI